jgi:hypothetical protein
MDKNKNKNKTNVLRSSRSIKMKEISGILVQQQSYQTLSSTMKNTSTSPSGSKPEEVKEPLQKLLKLLQLQDSDLQNLSDILEKTAKSIEGLLDKHERFIQDLINPKTPRLIKVLLQSFLRPDITKLKENLLKIAPTNGEGDVLKKLNDELSRPLSETVEIQRNVIIITYYFSK